MMSHGLIIPEGPLYAIFGHKPATASRRASPGSLAAD